MKNDTDGERRDNSLELLHFLRHWHFPAAELFILLNSPSLGILIFFMLVAEHCSWLIAIFGKYSLHIVTNYNVVVLQMCTQANVSHNARDPLC